MTYSANEIATSGIALLAMTKYNINLTVTEYNINLAMTVACASFRGAERRGNLK